MGGKWGKLWVDKAGEALRVGQGEGWVMGSGRERVKGGGKNG